MASKFDDLLPAIAAANDAGLTIGAIKAKFFGKSGGKAAKAREQELRDALASLVRRSVIWGPIKSKSTQYYFAVGKGPSIETASNIVVRLVAQSGVKLMSKPFLKKKVTGMHQRFFDDAVKHAVANRAIVELACGSSKYYLHRDVAADYFGFDAGTTDAHVPSAPPDVTDAATLAFETMLPVYRRLVAEQGGFSAVKIFDLIAALGRPKEAVHRLLVEEAKAGRVSIHHTTSVELPPAVLDAAIRLPGFAEPFVTVVVKTEP
jgi:hypothetical protein